MSDKDAMEKAAREYTDQQYGLRLPSMELVFEDGWKAAHQGPKVLALVECLKKISNPLTYDGKLAIEALKEFELDLTHNSD